MSDIVFTPEEVANMNANQLLRYMHGFTCPNRGDGKHDRSNSDLGGLFATVRGWECPFCDYTQNWAHDWQKRKPVKPRHCASARQAVPLRFRKGGCNEGDRGMSGSTLLDKLRNNVRFDGDVSALTLDTLVTVFDCRKQGYWVGDLLSRSHTQNKESARRYSFETAANMTRWEENDGYDIVFIEAKALDQTTKEV